MFIRTERLFLRPPWAEDAPAVLQQIGDWEVVRNLGRAPWPYTGVDAQAFCTGQVLADGEVAFLIFRRTRADPVLLGSIGLAPTLRPGTFELGFWLGRAHWGQGYAAEAGRAVLDLAFVGLRQSEVLARHFCDNVKSGKVLQRLGFTPSGEVQTSPGSARGCDVSSVGYGLARNAWATGRGCTLL